MLREDEEERFMTAVAQAAAIAAARASDVYETMYMDGDGVLTYTNGTEVGDTVEFEVGRIPQNERLQLQIKEGGGTPKVDEVHVDPGGRHPVSGSWIYTGSGQKHVMITLSFPPVPGQSDTWDFQSDGAPAIKLKVVVKRMA